MIWVFDSSPPIHLNKVGLQWIFTDGGEKIIPPQVYEQVVLQGEARGDADALASEELVKRGILQAAEVENGFKEALRNIGAGLHEGELYSLIGYMDIKDE